MLRRIAAATVATLVLVGCTSVDDAGDQGGSDDDTGPAATATDDTGDLGGGPVGRGVPGPMTSEPWLLVQDAELAITTGEGTDEPAQLTLTGSPAVTTLVDDGGHRAGSASSEALVESWTDLFGDRRPLAVLVGLEEGERTAVLVSLGAPRIDNEAVVYDVLLADGPPPRSVAAVLGAPTAADGSGGPRVASTSKRLSTTNCVPGACEPNARTSRPIPTA